MKRLLAKAEQQIRKLQEKVADQKQQIRELQAQAKHEDGLAAEREELKAEIADLKGEIKELTRANREHVEKLEALLGRERKAEGRGESSELERDADWRKPPRIACTLLIAEGWKSPGFSGGRCLNSLASQGAAS